MSACCMLQLSSIDVSSDTLKFDQMKFRRIELGDQQTTPRGEDIGNGVFRGEESIPFKDVIENSLDDDNTCLDIIYQLQYVVT